MEAPPNSASKERIGKPINRKVVFERYLDAKKIWPQFGRQIVGQFDDDAILVYQGTNRE